MIYPAAIWNPGVNAGYRAGRNTMTTAVAHFTVGRNSTGIGKQGYFHFLISRDGTVQQFCEADAVAWHAGDPWNSRGPGIEVEYLDEDTIFTDAARAACGELVKWLGIPLNFYDGPRIADWAGFITHRSLVQSGDAHSDYWPQEDWDAMTTITPLPLEETMWLIQDTATLVNWLATANGMIEVPGDQVWDLVAAGIKRYDVDSRTVAWLGQNLHGTPNTGGGTSVTVPAGPLKVTLTGTAIPA